MAQTAAVIFRRRMQDMRIRAVPDETLENGELEIRTMTWGSGSCSKASTAMSSVP